MGDGLWDVWVLGIPTGTDALRSFAEQFGVTERMAHEIAASVPRPVKRRVPRPHADRIAAALRRVGATAEVRAHDPAGAGPSSLPPPRESERPSALVRATPVPVATVRSSAPPAGEVLAGADAILGPGDRPPPPRRWIPVALFLGAFALGGALWGTFALFEEPPLEDPVDLALDAADSPDEVAQAYLRGAFVDADTYLADAPGVARHAALQRLVAQCAAAGAPRVLVGGLAPEVRHRTPTLLVELPDTEGARERIVEAYQRAFGDEPRPPPDRLGDHWLVVPLAP